MHVVIEARIERGSGGGVETVLLGLAQGLSELEGDDVFTFLVPSQRHEWLTARLTAPCTFRAEASPPAVSRPANRVAAWADARLGTAAGDRLRATRWRARDVAARAFGRSPLPACDVDLRGVDVVHFPFQMGWQTRVPSVFQPHDLQHLHLPHFFAPVERARRTTTYRALCRQASYVVVGSRWIARDVVSSLGVAAEKVKVVNLAPLPRAAAGPPPEALPAQFAYYPAATWPHKNHETLLRALALLRREGLEIPLVCSGHATPHQQRLVELSDELGLQQQVVFLGFVTDDVVAALYERARLVVVPTLYEAGSFPMWEAFAARVPVVCSSVTSLPEQAGDAALVFDARDERALATAMRTAWTDDATRRQLVEAGSLRIRSLSWTETARRFRAVYRCASGRATGEDVELLESASAM